MIKFTIFEKMADKPVETVESIFEREWGENNDEYEFYYKMRQE